jgi:hypothetical protein
MMTRWIAATAGALMLTAGLALAVPFGNTAVADGVNRPVFHGYHHKRCIAPSDWWSRGSQTTWVCSADETCCYDRLLRKGSCLPASRRCI